jgi:hypothetical protein
MAPQLWKEDKAASSCEDKKFTEEGETTEKRLIMVINLMDYLGDTILMSLPAQPTTRSFPRSFSAGSAQCRQIRRTSAMVFMNEALALTIALNESCHEPETMACRCKCSMLCVLDAKEGGKQDR